MSGVGVRVVSAASGVATLIRGWAASIRLGVPSLGGARWGLGLAAAGILLAAFLVLKMSPVATPVKWDECLYVYDAQRVLDGQVPYRDFFNFTPPAIFLVQAAWYTLWGGKATLTLGRLLAALITLAGSWLAYRAFRRSGWTQLASVVLASLYPVAAYAFWAVPSHHWLGVLCFLASFEAYDFRTNRVRGGFGWMGIGAAAGCAVLTLQTTALELALFWGTCWLLGPERRWRDAAAAVASAAGVAAPVILWFAAEGALASMARDVIVWPLTHYGQAGGPNAVGLLADWPSRVASLWVPVALASWRGILLAVSGTAAYALLLLAVLALVVAFARTLWRALREKGMGAGLTGPAMVLTAVELALFLRGKTDWLHLVYALVPLGAAWLVALGPWERWARAPRRFALILAWGMLVASAVFHSGRLLWGPPELWEFADVDRPVREAQVNRWLRSQPWLAPSDTLAVFPEGGQVYLYTRPSAVGYTLFLPLSEHYNSVEDHRIVTHEIETRRPKAILMTVDLERAYLDAASPLGGELAKDYRRLQQVGDAVVYVRGDAP